VVQTAIPIYSRQETFYVPRVEVYIRGQKLPSNVINDILQVTYKDSINEIDSFSIEINNWDAEKRKFKFVPPLKDSTQDFTGIFDPGQKIEVWMGYQNNMRRMMRGVITALEPTFSESAAPTLSVRGLNELHQYRTEQHTYSWTDGTKTDTDIARQLCDWPVKKGQPGLGIAFDPNPAPDETPEPVVFMNNQYDIVFLIERARRHGYEIYLEDEAPTPTLYFGLSENAGDAPVYQLEWGKSLISFRPTLSTAKQVGEVVVRGWDRKANRAIEEHYTLENLWKSQKKSPAEIARLRQIAQAYGNRTEVVTDQPAHTKKEAHDRAKAILEDQSKKLIEASGATIGLPDLRSGCSVEILGFGAQSDAAGNPVGAGGDFDGEYFVTESTHTIGSGGYRTEFSARREGPLKKRSQR
jgi:phage protein D